MNPARHIRREWKPTRLVRLVESYDTSMGTTKVKTDGTFAYLKAMGNRQGPHAVACELVGSHMAKAFGLVLPDFALLPLTADMCFDLPRANRTLPGPAFVSRHADGHTWGGSEAELHDLVNPEDLTRLIVFDTWVRNCDRHPPDPAARKPNYANVYLADTDEPGRSQLVAIDHTHCFDCGRDLTEHLADIDKTQDDRTYGLFPAFIRFIDLGQLVWCRSLLRSMARSMIDEAVGCIPAEWEVGQSARTALASQIHARAGFVADKIEKGWPLTS